MTEQVLTPEAESKHYPATYAEYLAYPQTTQLVEWVNGEMIEHMPPTIIHQDLASYLTTLLRLFADFFALGKVVSAPTEMKCRTDGNSREPDVMFIATTNLSRLQNEKRIEGPADLVIEIVSDDSVARDLDEKFAEYQECGVQEYWIIDPRPRRKRAWFYQRDDGNQFDFIKPEADGLYRSRVAPGFWIKVNWLWTLPDAQLTFAEVAGFSPSLLAELQARKRGG